MKQKSSLIFFISVFFLSSLSLGAWWGKPKKEAPKPPAEDQTNVERMPQLLPEVPAEPQVQTPEPAKQEPPRNEKPEKKNKKKKNESPKFKEMVVSGQPETAVTDNVQKELSDIIDRTSKLQGQVQTNRSEVLEIMKRAEINNRILNTMKVAQPVAKPVKVVDADEIVRREKLRLIAEQTKQAQKQLEILQQTRTIKQTSS